jgi:mono/diheme cytochrome c family protein
VIGKRILIIVAILVLVGLAVLAWTIFGPGPMGFAVGRRITLTEYRGKPTGVPADFPDTDALARGKYLTQAADCEACHTVEGGKPFAGGLPIITPFGTIYSPNITADLETGIGTWSNADFLRAVHEGIRKDGIRLYPAFPYAAYTYLTDEEVLAIKAYLFSLPAQKSHPPANTLRFPYNQRWLMAIWAALYNPNTRFQPLADRSPVYTAPCTRSRGRSAPSGSSPASSTRRRSSEIRT